MELLFFGPAALTCAVLPHMRKQRSAAIVQVSSLPGQSSSPGLSTYTAGKFALEGFEALTQVVNEFGIKVLVANPGAMRTDVGGAALVAAAILRVLADDSTPPRLALGPDALEVLGAAAAKQEDERVTSQSVSRTTVLAA
jgi:short-subunit dehydrogenase